ncbi:MAG: hypothetical protein HUJ16_12475, partial [Kangiella sp.]|nr:hypothetical protein [Kangiella sp.]
EIVVAAPGDEDDCLINSISFETGGESTPDVAEYPIDIVAGLADTDGSEALSVTIGGVPDGATLSTGSNNGDGTWTVSGDDLEGLSMSVPFEDEIEAFDLSFTATATEGANNSTANSAAVTVTAAAVETEVATADIEVTATIGEASISEGDDFISFDLDIDAMVNDLPAGNETSITVSGIPEGAVLSAGQDNGNGSWSLTPAQLGGLQVLVTDAVSTDFSLSVTAQVGDQSASAQDVLAEVDPSLFFEIGEEDFNNDSAVGNDTSKDNWTGNYQSETMAGSSKNDDLNSGGGGDTLYGGAGNDDLTGSWGEDTLYGGSGSDDLIGGSQDDVLFGGSGNDDLEGDSG